MILDRLLQRFGRQSADAGRTSRPRLNLGSDYSVIYAIGDVHGRLDLLRLLERKIVHEEQDTTGPKLIIQLGDMIDRGPHSAQTIDHMLSTPPSGWTRMALAGNHEATLCDAVTSSTIFERWLGFGGLETLGSYGIGQREIQSALGSTRRISDLLHATIPAEHLRFLRTLPITITSGAFVFAHAGGRPGIAIDEQEEKDLLWHNGKRDDSRSDGFVVVHGHEIVPEAEVHSGRINVDTGAYKSGTLTAVRLAHDAPPRVMKHSTH